MTTEVVPIQGLDQAGLIIDSPSIALPANAFSDALNVRFDDGAIRKIRGNTEIFAGHGLNDIQYIAYWPNPNQAVWVVVNRQLAGGIERDFIYTLSLAPDGSLAAINRSLDPLIGYDISASWQHTVFNGGYSFIINNGANTPQHLTVIQGSTLDITAPIATDSRFADLPGWNSYTVPAADRNDGGTGAVTNPTVAARIVVAFGNLLMAGGLIEQDGTTVIRNLRGVVRSSSVAPIGTVPQNWDPFQTGANTADELLIADTGEIVSMVPLQGRMMAYTTDSITQITVGLQGLSETNITREYGAASIGAVFEFDGRHVIQGSNDIYIFEGHPASIQSISDGRVRRFYYEDVHGSFTDRTRIIRNQTYDELWICYVSNSNNFGRLDSALTWNYRNNIWSRRSLPDLSAIAVGPIEGGGIDTEEFVFTLPTGRTATSMDNTGTMEEQTASLSGGSLGPGVFEQQRTTYSGTRSNVITPGINEVSRISIPSGFSGGVSGTASVTNQAIAASATTQFYIGGRAPGSSGGSIVGSSPSSTHAGTVELQRFTTTNTVRINNAFSTSGNNTAYWLETASGGGVIAIWAEGTANLPVNNAAVTLMNPVGATIAARENDNVLSLSGALSVGLGISNNNAGDTTSFITYDTANNRAYRMSRGSFEFATQAGNRLHRITITEIPAYRLRYRALGDKYSTGTFTLNTFNTTANISDTSPQTTGGDPIIPGEDTFSFSATARGVSTVTYDPDTANAVYNNQVTNLALPENATATAALTTLGNAIANLNPAITFDGVVGLAGGNNFIDIDLGTTTIINSSASIIANGAANSGITVVDQVIGSPIMGVATTYTVTSPDGGLVTSFTSSVSTTGASDIDTVRTMITNAINDMTQEPINYAAVLDTAASTITVTAGTRIPVATLWNINVNNQGQTTNMGNIEFTEFTEITPGESPGSFTGTITLPATFGTANFTVSNPTPGTTASDTVTQDTLITAIDTAIDSLGWSAARSGSNIVLSNTASGVVAGVATITLNAASAGSTLPTVGTFTETTAGSDDTVAGSLMLTEISPAGVRTLFFNEDQSGLTAEQVAANARAAIDARDAFVATGTGTNVAVQTTAFGASAPSLEVVANVGTFRNTDGTVTMDEGIVTRNQQQTRDLERPWPTTFINEGFNFVVGSSRQSATTYTVQAFDVSSGANGSDITSYVERRNIHLRPTKHTEMVHTFFLDAEGDAGSTTDTPQFNVRVRVTNAAGLANTVDLSTDTGNEAYTFTYGGLQADYKTDIRIHGRILNYRIEDVSQLDWSIAEMGIELGTGGTR